MTDAVDPLLTAEQGLAMEMGNLIIHDISLRTECRPGDS
jgi:hypothetical protein